MKNASIWENHRGVCQIQINARAFSPRLKCPKKERDNTESRIPKSLVYKSTLSGKSLVGGTGKILFITNSGVIFSSTESSASIFNGYILWVAAYDTCGAFFKRVLRHTATAQKHCHFAII